LAPAASQWSLQHSILTRLEKITAFVWKTGKNYRLAYLTIMWTQFRDLLDDNNKKIKAPFKPINKIVL